MSKGSGGNLDFGDLDPLSPDMFGPLGPAVGSPGPLDADAPPEAVEEAPADRRKKKEKKKRRRKERKTRGPGEGGGLLANLRQASPYNVILAASLGMILVAILCLVIELYRYGFSISAAS